MPAGTDHGTNFDLRNSPSPTDYNIKSDLIKPNTARPTMSRAKRSLDPRKSKLRTFTY